MPTAPALVPPVAGAKAPAPVLSGLEVRDIRKRYGGAYALKIDDGLTFAAGQVHALVGSNGSGKSTLVKVVTGIVRAESDGLIATPTARIPTQHMSPKAARSAHIHVVHQDPGLVAQFTVAENLALGRGYPCHAWGAVSQRELDSRARHALHRCEIDIAPDARVCDLNPAERAMLAIARALQGQDAETVATLLLDEPTVALTGTEVDSLEAAVRHCAERGQTVLFVSHRIDEVLRWADTVTVLRDGVVAERRPAKQWSAAELASAVSGIAATSQSLSRPRKTKSEPALVVDGLTAGPLCGVSMQVGYGEIVGVAGVAGAGRTSLLRALVAADGPCEVSVAGTSRKLRSIADAMRAGIIYLPADRREEAGFMDLPLGANLTIASLSRHWRRGWLSERSERARLRRVAIELVIRSSHPRLRLDQLSGGNQQKIIMSRLLSLAPTVLLLDEPSQGVDVGARRALQDMIHAACGAGAGALYVSSDLDELAEVCDRVLVLGGGRIEHVLEGHELSAAAIATAIYGGREATK